MPQKTNKPTYLQRKLLQAAEKGDTDSFLSWCTLLIDLTHSNQNLLTIWNTQIDDTRCYLGDLLIVLNEKLAEKLEPLYTQLSNSRNELS